MSLSPQSRQQQQEQLLRQAISHGPYLWSNRDVENALLWFRSSSSSSSANRENANDTITEESDDNAEGCEFLRRLLHARGIGMSRPLPDRSQRSNNTDKKRKKSSGGGGGGKSKKKDDDQNGRRLSVGQQQEKVGRKSSRNNVGGNGDDDGGAAAESPLQSVIMGYYQLFLPPPASTKTTTTTPNGNSQSSKCNSDNNDGEDNGIFTASDIKCAEMASSKLLDDLNSIILARTHTNEMYQAFTNVINGEDGKKEGGAVRAIPGMDTEMSQTIDAYMTHPTTCVRRVYASSVFDRLLGFCGGRGPDSIAATANDVDELDNENNIDNVNPALHKFLQKLFGLATSNVKIQEVILLLLLEPLRRLQARQQMQANESGQPEHSQKQMTQQEDLRKTHQSHQQSPDEELSPLLTSTSFWSDNSTKTIERVCTHPPLPALVQFILHTSPRHKPSIGDDHHNHTHSKTPSSAQTILWWTLPSPLLCTISQLYFPIACEYVRYWIDRAMDGHEKLYDGTPAEEQQQQQSGNNDSSLGANSTNKESSFQHAIQRIKQFCATSERLNLLGSHILNSMEKESQEVFEMSLLEEDENDAFRKSLAWKAIYREVF